jgi:hypothetical protein
MELEAPLDAFARQQQAGLGALARLSRPGDGDLPEPGAWDPGRDPGWDPRDPGDWDPPLAPPWAAGDLPYAEEPDIPDVSYRSLGRWR